MSYLPLLSQINIFFNTRPLIVGVVLVVRELAYATPAYVVPVVVEGVPYAAMCFCYGDRQGDEYKLVFHLLHSIYLQYQQCQMPL